MDAKLKREVTVVTKGIICFYVIGSVIIFILFRDSKAILLGLLFGCLVAMLNFRLLALNIQNTLSGSNLSIGRAQRFIVTGYFTRFLICAIVLVISAKADYLNIFSTAIGLISTQLVIFIKKLAIDKLTERRKRA